MKFFTESMARAASKTQVQAGDKICISPDLLLGHDGTWPQVVSAWKESGYRKSTESPFILTIDHAFPAPTIEDREMQKEMAEICANDRCILYSHGEGVLHQIVAETVDFSEGMTIVGADGHVATAGAYGAIAFSVSGSQLAAVLETGEYCMTVPEVITIVLDGVLADTVSARDIALYLLGKYSESIRGKAVLLKGSFFEHASKDTQMAICNLLPEGGAVTAVIPGFETEDEGRTIHLDIAKLERLAAVPPGPTNVVPVDEIGDRKIDVAIIGGCSAGRIEDMRISAAILDGNRIHPDVTLIVTPASVGIATKMDAEGITKIFRDSGAVIMPPGCGPCPGRHFGVLAPGDVAISTSIRNTPGRIGAKEAEIYLASPFTVAKSAIEGKIA